MGVATLAVVALSLSACGGGGGSSPSSPSPSPTENFVDSFKTVRGQFQHGAEIIGTEIAAAASQTDSQLEAAFKSLADKWQMVLSKLETLTPPADVQADFNTLKDAPSRAEADLNAIVSAAQSHDAAAAKQASLTLVNDIQAAKSAAQTIDQKLGIT
jgi:hypothetical protein